MGWAFRFECGRGFTPRRSRPGPGLDFIPPPDNLAGMSVAELQKTIRGLSAGDRKALAAIAARMKQRHAPARRRKLTVAMRAMDAGEKFTWNEVKKLRAERLAGGLNCFCA